MNRIKECLDRYDNGSSCAQSILSVYAPIWGLSERVAHKLASGLGGGFGRKQYLCGAVSAGALVLSLKYGNEENKDVEMKEETCTKVREYIDWFEKQMGTSSCRELLGIEIATPEGRKKARELNLFATKCKDCIIKVAEYLEKEISRGV